jgi:uncharacterized RDD family membrane protein YckC
MEHRSIGENARMELLDQPGAAAAAPRLTATPRVTGRRIAAGFLDLIPPVALFFLLATTVGTANTSDGNAQFHLDGWPALLWFVAVLGYYFVCELLWARTPGKALLGLRVVRADDGGRPGAGAIVARTLLRLIDGLPFFYGLGLLVVLVSQDRQRIGDLAARTQVVAG